MGIGAEGHDGRIELLMDGEWRFGRDFDEWGAEGEELEKAIKANAERCAAYYERNGHKVKGWRYRRFTALDRVLEWGWV